MSNLSQPRLLSRDEFKREVFRRDSERCVVCSDPAQDAHHLLERKLWPDGGYYLDNGVSVCGACHLEAERTTLTCEKLRELAGITRVLLPPHLDSSCRYDKWGNPFLDHTRRSPGELFFEPAVQELLRPVLHEFSHLFKYPRTFHLPWSPGVSSDDRVLSSIPWEGMEVVVTEKMDGECTSLYKDSLHARSLTYSPHDSRSQIKQLWSQIRQEIPDRWRICGENVTAVHSIRYAKLPHFFLVFSFWDSFNNCLSWDETVGYADVLGLHTVPVLYRGPWNEQLVKNLSSERDPSQFEGYVVRPVSGFRYTDFRRVVGKYVRTNHVQTDQHWMTKKVEYNEWQR